MKPILTLYATREGHAQHVAEQVAGELARQKFSAEVVDAARIYRNFSLSNFGAAILCTSVHFSKHGPEMKKFVKEHLRELAAMPSLFISISLSEASVEDETASVEARAQAAVNVKRLIDVFISETGWHPSHVQCVAGVLMYLKYNPEIRFVMPRIAKKKGAPAHTPRNYELTDWLTLHEVVSRFGEVLRALVPTY